jgi:hypothetical protein
VLDFEPTGFISDGIGPVPLDPNFVDKGPPSPNLSTDLASHVLCRPNAGYNPATTLINKRRVETL